MEKHVSEIMQEKEMEYIFIRGCRGSSMRKLEINLHNEGEMYKGFGSA